MNPTAILLCLGRVLLFFLRPIQKLINIRRPPKLPPIKNPLLKVSATTLAMKIRNRELSSQTVVEAYIERIKEVNPFLNAVVDERFEAAIREAKNCDENLKKGKVNAATLETKQPLYGVPVTIKESCGVEGLSHEVGRVERKGVKATKDSGAVETIKNAGGICLCVTNTPECCLGFNSSNLLHGTTKNPYDTRISAGGSSGGEGALIAAGASILGVGSDICGSVRVPSFCNGIFGHKPSSGIVPMDGQYPRCIGYRMEQMMVCGPLVRYAEDLYLSMKVLSAKYDKPLRLDEPVDLTTLRVFYADNMASLCGSISTSSEIKETIKIATKHLEQQGARVEKFSQEWIDLAYLIVLSCLCECDVTTVLQEDRTNKRRRRILELLKSIVGLSNYDLQLNLVLLFDEFNAFIPNSKREYYVRLADQCHDKLNELLGEDGVLVFPTYPHVASLPAITGLEFDCSAYTGVFNAFRLPATHIPMGLNDEGLPVGFQVIAAHGQDRICLALAKELEKAFGGWTPPSS